MGDEAAAERALEIGYRAYPASATLRERLEERYRSRSDWGKLAELRVLDAGAREDREERLSRLLEAANLWRSELGDPRSAARAFALAREVAPDDPSLLYEHVNALVEAGDPAARPRRRWARDRAADGGHGAPCGAARGAREHPRVDGRGRRRARGSRGGLRARTRALRRRARGAARARVRGRRAGTRPRCATSASVRRTCCRSPASRSERATILAELVKQDPKDREALETLANLEVALERWDAASATLRRLVGIVEGDAAVDAALRLADACERAGRPGDARGALERARLASPQHADRDARASRGSTS